MRGPILLLLASLLAGCAASPGLAPAAASLDAGGSATAEPAEVPLEARSGEFVLATSVPNPTCDGAGTAVGGGEGWIEWTLPEGTSAVRLELDASHDLASDTGYFVCVFAQDELVASGPIEDEAPFEAAVKASSVQVLLAPGSLTASYLNVGVRPTWTLSAFALVSAPEATA